MRVCKLKVIVAAIGIILAGLTTISSSFAADCTRDEADKAQVLAERAAGKIIDDFGGGRDIRASIPSCDFNTYDSQFRIKVEINWSGAFFRSHKYNIDGDLKFHANGTNAEFA